MTQHADDTAENLSNGKIYLIGHREVDHQIGPMGVGPSFKSPVDYHKIGVACNPRQRLSNLRIGTPHELELITTLESDNAEVVESQLHSIYRANKKSGEWFRLTINDVNSLVALNQLNPEDLEPLNKRLYPPWTGEQSSLYLEVERVRRGDDDE